MTRRQATLKLAQGHKHYGCNHTGIVMQTPWKMNIYINLCLPICDQDRSLANVEATSIQSLGKDLSQQDEPVTALG